MTQVYHGISRLFCFTARACAGDFGKDSVDLFPPLKAILWGWVAGPSTVINRPCYNKTFKTQPMSSISSTKILKRNVLQLFLHVICQWNLAPFPSNRIVATWLLVFGAEVPGNCQVWWKTLIASGLRSSEGLCKSGITWGFYDVLWCGVIR